MAKRNEGDVPRAENQDGIDIGKLMADVDDDGKHFLIPASDSKGKSAQVQFRVQPSHIRQLEVILQSRRFPYKTLSDMLRHAVVGHLKWLEMQKPDPDSMLWKILAMDEILKDQEIDATFDKTMAVMDEAIRRHINGGDEDRAKALVRDMWSRLQTANDGHLKMSYCRKMRKAYGHLLPKKGEPLSFMDMDDTDDED